MLARRRLLFACALLAGCAAGPAPSISSASSSCPKQPDDWPSTFSGFWRVRDQALYYDSGIVTLEQRGIVVFAFESGGGYRRPIRWERVDACTWRGVDDEAPRFPLVLDARDRSITQEHESGRDTLRPVEPTIEAACATRFRAVAPEIEPWPKKR